MRRAEPSSVLEDECPMGLQLPPTPRRRGRRRKDSYVDDVVDILLGWMEEQEWLEDGERVFYITQVKVLLGHKGEHVDFIALPRQTTSKVNKRIREYIKVINWYSDPEINKHAGWWAEDRFEKVMLLHGFRREGKNVREWNGRTWGKSLEDLDFIFSRDGIAYGVEIKNKFSYEDLSTWESKAAICEELGVKPLFVTRSIPLDHQYKLRDKDAFFLRFKAKMFPPTYKQEVVDLYELTHLPVTHEAGFPPRAFSVFLRWHEKKCRPT